MERRSAGNTRKVIVDASAATHQTSLHGTQETVLPTYLTTYLPTTSTAVNKKWGRQLCERRKLCTESIAESGLRKISTAEFSYIQDGRGHETRPKPKPRLRLEQGDERSRSRGRSRSVRVVTRVGGGREGAGTISTAGEVIYTT